MNRGRQAATSRHHAEENEPLFVQGPWYPLSDHILTLPLDPRWRVSAGEPEVPMTAAGTWGGGEKTDGCWPDELRQHPPERAVYPSRQHGTRTSDSATVRCSPPTIRWTRSNTDERRKVTGAR